MSESSVSPTMRWPRITVVTPSYNQGKYIERTVRSVLLQRYPNLDYILMDGGSTDDTVRRLAPYQDQFSFFASEPDNGQADAIAKGFARSSGEIMAYLNSDDLLAPDTLRFVANYFQRHPDVDCIYSHRCTIDEKDRVLWYWILPPHLGFLMKRWDFIPQETCFWRRSLFEKAGNVDTSYHFAIDYDLFVRFMNSGRVRRINRFFGAFRQHSESKTTQLLGAMGRREMLKVRQKFGISRLPRDGFFGMLLGQWVSRAGGRFAASGRSLPGAFPGAGYDYNDFWGGVLRRADLPCARHEQNRINKSNKSPYEPICPITLRFPDRLLFSIASTGAGEEVTSDIYIQYTSRTAIILPSMMEYWRKPKAKSLEDQVAGKQLTNDHASNLRHDAAREALAVVQGIGAGAPEVDRIRSAEARQIVDQILGLTRGLVSENHDRSFLDVSCHAGELLDALKTRTNWKLFGLEPSHSAATEAISKGHRVFEATLEEAPDLPEITKCFDLIYLGHGIERFEAPRVSLRSLALLLNPGGFLILSTPNLDSEQLKRSGPAWAHWKPERNRFIYSPKSLKRILALTGFRLTRLWTGSYPESTADSLRIRNNGGTAALASGEQTEMVGRSGGLTRSRLGKGDVIFAICRRIS